MKKKLKINIIWKEIDIWKRRGFLGGLTKSDDYQNFWDNDSSLIRILAVLEKKKDLPKNILELRTAMAQSHRNIKDSVDIRVNSASVVDVGNVLDQIYEFYL